MRESLTILTALLVLCLSIALAAPYFVDWNAQRDVIEAQLSRAIGEKVNIRGNLDLKLLPTPYLHLQDIDIPDAAFGSFTATDVFLEISIPPLLHGEFDFTEARIQSPHLKLIQSAEGTLRAPRPQGFSGQARFERIALVDGKIEIDEPAHVAAMSLDHVDLNAEAESLEGPFKGDGKSVIAGETTAFRFSTGPREGDSIRLKLIIDKSKTHPRADFDGKLSFEYRRNGSFSTAFSGNAGFSGIWHGSCSTTSVSVNTVNVPWRLNGSLKIADRKASMAAFDLHLGDEDHSVNTGGSAELDFSAAPKANVNLRARQIDIDRLLTEASPTQPGKTMEQSLALFNDERLSFPIPLKLDASVETVTLNSETLTDLSGALVLNQDQPAWLRFESSLPGHSHIHADGRFEPGSAMRFDGRVDANSSELDRLANWLDGVSPSAARDIRKLPFHTVELGGEATLSRVGFAGRGLNLHLDRSNLSGDLSFTQAAGGDPARLFIDMSAESLDLDSLPNLADAPDFASKTDLSIRFDAQSVKIASLRTGSFDTGEIRVKLTKTAGETNLEDLSLNGLGGATIAAKGKWTGHTGYLDAKINAPRLGDVTKLLRHLLPTPSPQSDWQSDWIEALDQRATALSPMNLDLHAEAAANTTMRPILTALNLTGTAGATQLRATVKSDPKGPRGGTAEATLDAPDAGTLLRQLGPRVLPINGLGRGHIDIKTQGPLSGTPDTIMQAALAGANITFHGRVDLLPDAPAATGRVTLSSTDLSSLLRVTKFAFPDLTARVPADVTTDLDWRGARVDLNNLKGTFAGLAVAGHLIYAPQGGTRKLTGAVDLDKCSAGTLMQLALGAPQPPKSGYLWSNLSFGTSLSDAPLTSVTLRAKMFEVLPGLSGQNAALQLEIAPDVFTFRDFTMKAGDGTASGTLAVRRDGPMAAVTGHLAFDNYGFVLPSLRAHASTDLDIAGSGQNALALMASLAGSGRASLRDIAVPHAEPGTLGRVFADVEHDRLNVDETEIANALAREFDRGTLGAGTRPFDLTVAAGVLRLASAPVKEVEGSPVSIENMSFSLDLRSAAIEERLGFVLLALPKDWQGGPPRLAVEFKGPFTSPVRTIQSAGFVNALAARSIAREAARIQAYEFDLHERTVFNQRLESDRRHDLELLKAEEDARRAAEDARKAEDAARLEKLRKAEEARRKAEDPMRTNSTPDPRPQSPSPPPAAGNAGDPSAFGHY